MWPWGHLGVAYILYSLYAWGRFRRPPRPEPALAVFVGSQVPDLVDKPLALFGVIPHGRFLAHALVVAAVVVAVAFAAGIVRDRVETTTAFSVAYLSHLAADVPPQALLGFPFGTEYLFWPAISHPTFNPWRRVFEPPELVERLVIPLLHPGVEFLFNWAVFGLAVTLWLVGGCPGLEYVTADSEPNRGTDRTR